MTEPFRLPLELSAEETMYLRKTLERLGPIAPGHRAVMRRLEDHYGAVRRAEEQARHDAHVTRRRPQDDRGWKPD